MQKNIPNIPNISDIKKVNHIKEHGEIIMAVLLSGKETMDAFLNQILQKQKV